MNPFEKKILKYLGKRNFNKVQKVKVGIAGAGGLGSNCAANLVRTGFKKFKIVDFDNVDYTNLNRQFFFLDQVGMNKVAALKKNLKRINPDIEVEAVKARLNASNIGGMFDDCDVIAEAFDKAECKRMLVEKFLGGGKFIVSASGLAGVGDTDEIRVHRVKKNLVIIGDMKSDIRHKPPMSPRVNIAAAKQADVILEHIIG